MKRISTILFIFTLLSTQVFAQNFKDLPESDPNQQAVKYAVKKGYLSLYQDQLFRPDQPLTRKEMAVILEKLASDLDNKRSSQAEVDLQELSQSPKIFKQSVTQLEGSITAIDAQQKKVNSEFDTLHDDLTKNSDFLKSELSKTNEELNKSNIELNKANEALRLELTKMKSETQSQRMYLWIGIAGAALLGMIIN